MSNKWNEMVLEAVARERPSGINGVIRAVCPFCVLSGHNTRKKKLDYIPSSGKWSCWRCKTWGRLTPQDALNGALRGPRRGGNAPSLVEPPEGFFPLGEWPSPISRPAHDYAMKRGISRVAIAAAGMGMTQHRANRDEGEQDFRGRLIVPIFEPESASSGSRNWLGYVGRDYTGRSNLPYLYSRGMSRAKVIYREEVLWEETDVPALGVEGTLDAAFMWPEAFAVLGTWGPEQMDKIRRARRPVVWVLDGDAWRKGEAAAMAQEIMGIRGGWLKLPPGKDPDNMDRGWIREMARRAVR